jgi:hypothetical protein
MAEQRRNTLSARLDQIGAHLTKMDEQHLENMKRQYAGYHKTQKWYHRRIACTYIKNHYVLIAALVLGLFLPFGLLVFYMDALAHAKFHLDYLKRARAFELKHYKTAQVLKMITVIYHKKQLLDTDELEEVLNAFIYML